MVTNKQLFVHIEADDTCRLESRVFVSNLSRSGHPFVTHHLHSRSALAVAAIESHRNKSIPAE